VSLKWRALEKRGRVFKDIQNFNSMKVGLKFAFVDATPEKNSTQGHKSFPMTALTPFMNISNRASAVS
jgi:hypothetical protein